MTQAAKYYIKPTAGEGWPHFGTVEEAVRDFVDNAPEFERLNMAAWEKAQDAIEEPDVWTLETANAYLSALADAYEAAGGDLWMSGKGGVIGRQEFAVAEWEA